MTIYTVTIESNQTQTCPTHHVHCFFPRQIAAAEVLSAQTWQKSRVSLPQVEKKTHGGKLSSEPTGINSHTYIQYITLHYITLHYITLHYITLYYITLHYIALHTYNCIYMYDYIYIMKQDQNYLYQINKNDGSC